MRQIVTVGAFFDAEDCVPIAQAHVMADPESLGEVGVGFLEQLAALPEDERRVRVPTTTDPRGVDFKCYRELGQSEAQADLERRAIAAFEALGLLLTNTCINYQTVLPPVRGEHLAYGDTGSSIYANSVLGARTNFEGGPSALAAALTGRVPRYGFHLEERRRGTRRFRLEVRGGSGALESRRQRFLLRPSGCQTRKAAFFLPRSNSGDARESGDSPMDRRRLAFTALLAWAVAAFGCELRDPGCDRIGQQTDRLVVRDDERFDPATRQRSTDQRLLAPGSVPVI